MTPMTDAEIDAAYEAWLEERAHVNDDPRYCPHGIAYASHGGDTCMFCSGDMADDMATATVIPAGALFEARERAAKPAPTTRASKEVQRIADYAGVDARRLAEVLKRVQ